MSEPIEIPVSLEGERIDRVVALLSGRSRAEVAELIGTEAILLGGKPINSRHRRVVTGERLVLDLPPRATPRVEADETGTIVFEVVYEDEDLIIVDKPAGLVVHPGAGHRHDTLISGLLARFPDLAEVEASNGWDAARPGIVHRLDKDTSGLLVVARNVAAYTSLVAQLAERTVGRTYRSLALNEVVSMQGTIDAPLGRSDRDPTRFAVRGDGRPARTHYRVLERYSMPLSCTLLELQLETGRTHQIRVHLAAIGHPVAGDRRYGGTARALGLTRPFLHAERLVLTHPRTGTRIEMASALPEDLSEVLAQLS